MDLSTDLKIREQYGLGAAVSGGTPAPSGGSGFSQVFSAALQASGGTNYENYFQLAADTYQVPVNLIKGLANAESGFNPNAVSRCGAQGIMQLMPGTARAMGVTNAFDPAQNIMGGTKYLRQMLDTFDGDVPTALAAYNAGPGAIKRNGGMMSSQKNYVDKILRYAGGNVTVPVRSGSFSGPAGSGESMFVSDDSLTLDDLAELIVQAYNSDSAGNQGYVHMLLQQIFMKNVRELEDQELNVSL